MLQFYYTRLVFKSHFLVFFPRCIAALHNLQGVIVGLLDNSGSLVVEYKHDAWGRLLSTTGSLDDTLGKRKPFRYRGHVFDEETELYCLRSRYYIAEWEQFVNADDTEYVLEGMLINNPFAY